MPEHIGNVVSVTANQVCSVRIEGNETSILAEVRRRTRALALASTAAYTRYLDSIRQPIVDEYVEGQVPARQEIRGVGVEGDEAAIGTNSGPQRPAGIIPLIASTIHADPLGDPCRVRQRRPRTEKANGQEL